MAIVVQYSIKGMPAATYDNIIRDLDAAGEGMPDGRKYHTSYGDPAGLQVIDVFESPAHLQAFGGKLMPILAKYGVEAVPNVLGETHGIIVGRCPSAASEANMTAPATADLNTLARAAIAGDSAALDQLLATLLDDVYRLALRTLGHPADAEDAAQEALIQILTGLSTFRGDASVRTWAFRIAIRHYMRFRKGRYEAMVENFDSIDQVIEAWRQVPAAELSATEIATYAEEVKWTCLSAILLALTRDERIAYTLVEVFGVDGAEAAEILEVDAATFRKRLQRGRDALAKYMTKTCGLVNEAADCRCTRQVPVHIHFDFVGPEKLSFSRHPARRPGKAADAARLQALVDTERVAEVMRSHPEYIAPDSLADRVRAFVRQGGLRGIE